MENHYDFLNVHHHKSNVEMERIFKSLGDFENANDNRGQRIRSVEVCGESELWLMVHGSWLMVHGSWFRVTQIAQITRKNWW